MEYHSGNYDKYTSANVLKKLMIGKFNQKVIGQSLDVLRVFKIF